MRYFYIFILTLILISCNEKKGYSKVKIQYGERIEIRGFGSFCLHYRPPRIGRNPKSGEPVTLSEKHVPHFKPGKELRERVNNQINKMDIVNN